MLTLPDSLVFIQTVVQMFTENSVGSLQIVKIQDFVVNIETCWQLGQQTINTTKTIKTTHNN